MEVLDQIKDVRSIFKNWLTLGLKMKLGKSDKFRVVLESGQEYMLWRNQVHALIQFVKKGVPLDETLRDLLQDRVPYRGYSLIVHGWIREGNINNGNIFDVFINEDYKFLKVKNRVVIDIGASIGDSSIYFAFNGATRVIGLEPYPYSFNLAVRNVKENNMDEKILLLNAGYGQDGEVLVDDNLESNDTMELRPSEKGRKVKIYSLKNLIEKFDLSTAILKMDCEGCEYDLLKEENSTLAIFSQMQIEYHYGPEKLVSKLETAGFTVKFTEPKKSYNPYVQNHNMESGYIYAEKQQENR